MVYTIKNITPSNITIEGEEFVKNVAVNLVASTSIQTQKGAAELVAKVWQGEFKCYKNGNELSVSEGVDLINKTNYLYQGLSNVNDRFLEKDWDTQNGI